LEYYLRYATWQSVVFQAIAMAAEKRKDAHGKVRFRERRTVAGKMFRAFAHRADADVAIQ
jgi:hypothetical protein